MGSEKVLEMDSGDGYTTLHLVTTEHLRCFQKKRHSVSLVSYRLKMN